MPLKCHLSCECCRPQDTVTQCDTLASEVCDQVERGPSPTSRSSSSSPTQHHRDKRAFFWNRALVRLRNSFRSSNKVSSESSLSPHQQNSSAQVNSACVRLSTTSNSVEEDFVWLVETWATENWGKILSTQCSGAWNTKSQMATRTGRAFMINISQHVTRHKKESHWGHQWIELQSAFKSWSSKVTFITFVFHIFSWSILIYVVWTRAQVVCFSWI